jgi:hypothetical protein
MTGQVRLGPGDLTAEHRDLMTEHHDLRVLGRLAAAEQHQPAEDPDHDQVEQTKGHKPRSCAIGSSCRGPFCDLVALGLGGGRGVG